jgi:hypothetical protein
VTLGDADFRKSPMKMIYRKFPKTASLPVTCHPHGEVKAKYDFQRFIVYALFPSELTLPVTGAHASKSETKHSARARLHVDGVVRVQVYVCARHLGWALYR